MSEGTGKNWVSDQTRDRIKAALPKIEAMPPPSKGTVGFTGPRQRGGGGGEITKGTEQYQKYQMVTANTPGWDDDLSHP